MINLNSKYFTWSEVLASQTAARLNLVNTPDDETQATIAHTAQRMDAIRSFLAHAVLVSSWFRNLKVNSAVGSKPNSQHVKGEAVDFTCPGFGDCNEVFAALKAKMVEFGIDQLIREYPNHSNGGWVHASFTDTPRHSAFSIGE